MAASQQAVVQEWFKLADQDKDGAIAGGEAVQFFKRSGLDNGTLGQVWELASGGAPKLNQVQFSAAIRLVALAQTQGGRLDVAQARVIVAGMGPALPLPRMAGLEQYAEPAKPAPGPGAAFATAGYVPQMTGASSVQSMPSQQPSYAPQFTGAGYTPGPPAAQGAGSGGGALPPATPADLQRYQAAFQQLDADRDGVVQGSDCFTYFMQWGLDKAVLRHIWEIVAGNSATLTQPQLTSCLYLMDAAKRGIRPPLKLPPGPFPPVAQQWSLQSQFGGATGAAAVGSAGSQQALVPPTFPNLPVKFTEADGAAEAAAGTAPRASQVPNLSSSMAGLDQGQRDKIASELKEATARETTLFTVEDRAAQTKARIAAFNAAMQEVTVFKSRTDVAMLQAQDQVARLEDELATTRTKYEKAHSQAQSQGENARKLRELLGKLMADRTEQEGKLLQLEAEIAAANAVTPADVQRMEAEVQMLHARIAEAEAVANAKGSQLAGIRQQRTALEAKLTEVKAAAAAAHDEVNTMQKQVSELQAAVAAARAAAGTDGGAGGMAPLLTKAAQLYRSLYSATSKAGAEVPFDTLPTNLGLACWMDDAMEGVVDWNDMDDDARGYVLVNALPGQRIQLEKNKTSGAAAAAAAAAPPTSSSAPAPMSVDAFGEQPAFGATPAAVSSGGFDEPPASFGAAAAKAPQPQVAAAAPVAAAAAPAAAAAGFGATTSVGFDDDAPAFPTAAPASAPAAAPAATPAAPAAAAAKAPAVVSGFEDDAPAF